MLLDYLFDSSFYESPLSYSSLQNQMLNLQWHNIMAGDVFLKKEIGSVVIEGLG